MTIVQIMMHRELSVEDGQQILANMSQAIVGRAPTATFGVVHLPGQTRRENPFPEWFRTAIEKSKFRYQDINLVYQRKFSEEHLAIKFMEWFDTSFRPFCIQQAGEEFTKNVHIRVMGEHEDLGSSDSF